MTTLRCEKCDGPMPVVKRQHARFCSGRCRVAAHRAKRSLPREMTSLDRWVRRSERKAPLTAKGRAASSTDPATWCTYREAKTSKAGAGLGFVLNGDGIVCVDLDHCVDDRGRVAAWAQRILDDLPATYVEVSASGGGLHVFGYGRVERGRRVRRGDIAVEVYGNLRYIAVTGRRHGSAPARLADISEALASLV